MKYMKPTTCVVKLKNQTNFLAGSPGSEPGSGNQGSGNSRELRSVWKDDEE